MRLLSIAILLGLALCIGHAPARAEVGAHGLLLGKLVGTQQMVTIKPKDTLVALAMTHGIGYVELRAANPDVDVWLPEPGRTLRLPTLNIAPHPEGAAVVVNRAEMRLYVYPPEGRIWSAPISLGRDGYETPLGRLPVGQKRLNPAWYPTVAHRAENPDLPKVVPAGAANPLGRHALRLGDTVYLLHGTNRPDSIGRQVSRGCIRLAPQDVALLYEQVDVGMDVRIVDAPAKLALHEGRLYLEIAPSIDQIRAYDFGLPIPDDPYPSIEKALHAAVGDLAAAIDWSVVAHTARERRGMPVAITGPVDGDSFPNTAISASSD